MGSILTRANKIWDNLKADGIQKRILILGLDAAGKTTILYRMKMKKKVNTAPTIGFNVEKIETCSGLTFIMWDIGGQNKVRELWKHYCQDTAGLLFVVDSSDRERLWEARHELHKILEEDALAGVPCIILANKQDVPAAMTPAELVAGLGLDRLSGTNKWEIQTTCAISGQGISDGMTSLARMIKAQQKSSSTSS